MAQALPKNFSLKSSQTNKYLAYLKEEGDTHGLLKFSAEDVSALAVFEVEPAQSGNGLVHVRCSYNNKFWRRQSPKSYWIAAEADEHEEDQSKWSCTLFKPTLVDAEAKTFQLMHVQLGHYACSWRTANPFTYCLYLASERPDTDKFDIFNITELVAASREIMDVEFSFKDAKIYDQTTVALGQGIAVNNGYDSDAVKTVTIDYTREESRIWKSNNGSSNSEIVTHMESGIPMVVNEKTVLLGNEFSGPYQMGKPMVLKNIAKTSYDIVIPPRTMMIVTLKATKASTDIPFSFTRRDTLSDEKVLSFDKRDGTYTSVTLFNLKYEAEKRPRY